MRILITGATGLVGRSLMAQTSDTIGVSRRPPAPTGGGDASGVRWMGWAHPTASPLPVRSSDGVDAIVHLMGEPIAEGRWSADKKERIRASRVESTRNIVQAIARLESPPQVLVSASAMGYYGSRGDLELDEAASSGLDFLAGVCREWEEQAIAARDLGVRVVLLRLGLVLGHGGFLAKVLPWFRRGMGGKLGSGRQWTSWIHIDDLIRMIIESCQQPDWSGPFNAASPFPVRNAELTRALAACVGRPAILPVPRLALWTLYGEMADALTASIRMRPAKALGHGFQYRYLRIADALEDLVATSPFESGVVDPSEGEPPGD
jgi:uncharacterized protein (TIGR01777 family)